MIPARCAYLGRGIQHPCACHAQGFVAIHDCELHRCKTFVETDDLGLALDKLGDYERGHARNCATCRDRSAFRFVRTDDLMRDAMRLSEMLPARIAAVAGVARSGILPATLIAMMRHVPLLIVSDAVRPSGSGWRLETKGPELRSQDAGMIVVVDDTTMTGQSLQEAKRVVGRQYDHGRVMFASVYCNPEAADRPAVWAVDLMKPHFLEWNLFNSVYGRFTAYDFDGIFCHDIHPDHDDDGCMYLRALRTAGPLYLPRREKIPLIVTSRLERYRQPSEAWLNKWLIRYDRLECGPWDDNAARARPMAVSKFKAGHFEQLIRLMSKEAEWCSGPFYVESDPVQAKEINELTGGVVICPTSATVHGEAR